MRQEKLAKVAKVIGLSKLRSKFESHEAKRTLCAQYDLFLADDRIIPSLPKLIGDCQKTSPHSDVSSCAHAPSTAVCLYEALNFLFPRGTQLTCSQLAIQICSPPLAGQRMCQNREWRVLTSFESRTSQALCVCLI